MTDTQPDIKMTEKRAREILFRCKSHDKNHWCDNSKDVLYCEGFLAGIEYARKEAKGLLEACEAVDIYFKALCEQWAANDGRVVSESGVVIEGSTDVERLCEIAAEKVVTALAAYKARRKNNE